jgi:hypothetical protein
MSIEIKWTDTDPETNERRWVRAERAAKLWRFTYRHHRRGVWSAGPAPTRGMWEHVLDALERRYRRREGVTEADLVEVQRILARLPKTDAAEEE